MVNIIFAILIPIFSLAFTIASFTIKKNPVTPIFSTVLWFASSMWTININRVFDYTSGAGAYYISPGNWEVGTLFMVLGSIMGLFSLMVTVERAISIGWLGGKKDG